MSKAESFELIPLNDRNEFLEEQVQRYLIDIAMLPINSHKYHRVVIPDFEGDVKSEFEFYKQEIERCKYGYKNMSGKMYFFYNYAYIKNLSGAIRPEFRVCQNEWYNTVERAQNSKEYGVVCVKRRRLGASWLEASDVVHDAIFNKHFHIGMNSMSEKDSEHLFAKVMFIHSRLPDFLKANIGRKNGMNLEFFRYVKNDKGEKIKSGNQSSLVVVAPTESAYEGLMLNKWICDEAGKIPILPQLWSFTEDCLMQETVRAGTPILFGTSGDIATNGGGLMHMWDKNEQYKLIRFFFGGWMGLAVDELGNDRVEEAVRWVIYQRKIKESIDPKSYNDFIQKYPLTPDEAFSSSAGGLGNIVRINAQRAEIRNNPPIVSEGVMRYDMEINSAEFTPKKNGAIKIYEHPIPGMVYAAGCDPADHDDPEWGASDMSTHIMTMPDGINPPRIVAEYTDRPTKAAAYYNNAAALLRYFNNTKALIENNRFGMIDHFQRSGFEDLLEYAPHPLNKLVRVRPNQIGVRMTPDFKDFMEHVIEDYIEDYCDYIPSIDLLREFTEYGSKNTDRVMSFGLTLCLIKSKTIRGYKKPTGKEYNPRVPDIRYKMVNGRIKRVHSPGRDQHKRH